MLVSIDLSGNASPDTSSCRNASEGVVYKGRDEVFSIYILLGGNQVL